MAFLGVIGGLGPMATAYFMELITAMTAAEKDQEHLKMLVYSVPALPDRTAYILGKSKESPLSGLVEAGRALGTLGVDLLAIPCITAHYFHEQIEEQTGISVVHAIRESAVLLKEAGVSRVGLMATDGTVQSKLFQKEFEKQGIAVMIPSESGQAKVMSRIYDDVKMGNAPDMTAFEEVGKELRAQGAQVILLGCTELSLIKRSNPLSREYLDVMEVLARAVLLKTGTPIREEYKDLLSNTKQEMLV